MSRRPPVPLPARMLAKIDREVGSIPEDESLGRCWIWKGARNADGYGIVRGEGKDAPLMLAHRVALSLAIDRPIAPGMVAAHRCDTPACVRPRHLYEATFKENNDDIVARGHRNVEQDELGRWRRRPVRHEGQTYG